MNSEMRAALSYLLVAGLINSAYTLPLKLNLRWKWENLWFVFTAVGLCMLPATAGAMTIPRFWSIYSQVGLGSLVVVAFSGLTWGLGMLFSGIAVDIIGVAAMFATVMGTSAGVGAILPLFSRGVTAITMKDGWILAVGISLTLLGVALCGVAGRQREKDSTWATSSEKRPAFFRGFPSLYSPAF